MFYLLHLTCPASPSGTGTNAHHFTLVQEFHWILTALATDDPDRPGQGFSFMQSKYIDWLAPGDEIDGTDGEDWSIKNLEDLETRWPEAFTLYERTIKKVQTPVSASTLSQFENMIKGGSLAKCKLPKTKKRSCCGGVNKWNRKEKYGMNVLVQFKGMLYKSIMGGGKKNKGKRPDRWSEKQPSAVNRWTLLGKCS